MRCQAIKLIYEKSTSRNKKNKCGIVNVLIVTEVNTILSVVLVPHY